MNDYTLTDGNQALMSARLTMSDAELANKQASQDQTSNYTWLLGTPESLNLPKYDYYFIAKRVILTVTD